MYDIIVPPEPEPLDRARRHYMENKDPGGVLALMPRRRCVESKQAVVGAEGEEGPQRHPGGLQLCKEGGGGVWRM